MRPKHPHAAESGVGKHTARESESAKACAAGKERVANAHPHKLAPEASKTSGAFFVLARMHHLLLAFGNEQDSRELAAVASFQASGLR